MSHSKQAGKRGNSEVSNYKVETQEKFTQTEKEKAEINGSKGNGSILLFGRVSNPSVTVYIHIPTAVLVCGRKILLLSFKIWFQTGNSVS